MIFPFFKKRIKGAIGYYGLGDWWIKSLSKYERERIISAFSVHSLVEEDIFAMSGTAMGYLSVIADRFDNEADRGIAYKILQKANELVSESPVLDQHFFYQAEIQIYYKFRAVDTFAFEKAVEACRKQIALSLSAREEFLREYPNDALPAHVGYEQLAIILEKDTKFDEAIEICEKALKQGWNSDWQQRIDRCKKKIAKAASKTSSL